MDLDVRANQIACLDSRLERDMETFEAPMGILEKPTTTRGESMVN